MEKTMYQSIYGETNYSTKGEVTIKTDSKKALKKALAAVFGDNADCYMELAINTGNGYELALSPNYAIEVFNNL